MNAMHEPSRFIVIGENIHATRVVLRDGPKVSHDDGAVAVRFDGLDGSPKRLPVAQPILESNEYRTGKVKHVRNAVLLAMGASGELPAELTGAASASEGELAREYLLAMAQRQASAGASYLDLNVDELSATEEVRAAAMAWLVRLIEPHVAVPISLDSSSTAVLRAGLEASIRPSGSPLINSASVDRPDVLDLAAAADSPVVLSCVGESGMPVDAKDRFANATRIVGEARSRGLRHEQLFIDPLVLPAAVDPEAGRAYLDAVRSIRSGFGPAIHITGGLSNVSFGLPARRLLNDVFIVLATEAGIDSGIVDPVTTDLGCLREIDRSTAGFKVAEALLLGDDPYGGEYLMAFREGRL